MGRFSLLIIALLFLTVTVASHTVSSFASVVSTAIYAVSGVATVYHESRAVRPTSSPAQSNLRPDLDRLEAQNLRLQQDFETASRNADRLSAELAGERESNARLTQQTRAANLSLAQERARSASLNAEMLAERARLANMNVELVRERSLAAQANANISRLQVSNANLALEANQLRGRSMVRLGGQLIDVRQATATTLQRIAERTRNAALANAGSATAESIPFFGIAVIVAATAFELDAACRNMTEIYELQVSLGTADAIPPDREEDCGFQRPTKEEIWAAIKASPGLVWQKAQELVAATPGWAAELPTPDFSGRWEHFLNWIWFD